MKATRSRQLRLNKMRKQRPTGQTPKLQLIQQLQTLTLKQPMRLMHWHLRQPSSGKRRMLSRSLYLPHRRQDIVAQTILPQFRPTANVHPHQMIRSASKPKVRSVGPTTRATTQHDTRLVHRATTNQSPPPVSAVSHLLRTNVRQTRSAGSTENAVPT